MLSPRDRRLFKGGGCSSVIGILGVQSVSHQPGRVEAETGSDRVYLVVFDIYNLLLHKPCHALWLSPSTSTCVGYWCGHMTHYFIHEGSVQVVCLF